MERKTENKNVTLTTDQGNAKKKFSLAFLKKNNTREFKKTQKICKKTKLETALFFIIENPQRVTTEDARRLYGDTCLHTTISDFNRKFGIVAKRKNISLNNQFRTHVMRYWFADDDMNKAKRIVDQLRAKRGKKPLYHDINVMY